MKDLTLKADVNGVVDHIGTNDFMFSFYEIIINSIQAIEEKFHDKQNPAENGSIEIWIKREPRDGDLFNQYERHPITAICVEDNGIGLTESNIASFSTVYSPKKQKVGGKVLGDFRFYRSSTKSLSTANMKGM